MLLTWPMNSANASGRYAGSLSPYSLALRLRDAGISADVICQYVNVESDALGLRVPHGRSETLCGAKLTGDRYHGCR